MPCGRVTEVDRSGGQLHAPPRPHRVLDARRRRPDRGGRRRRGGRRPAGARASPTTATCTAILDFYKECRDQGIKPIIGSELYMAHESRFERPSRRGRMDDGGGDAEGGAKLYYHLTALAETDEGYRNLIQLSSEAFLSGYYYKPTVDFDLLAEHSKGLIATSGCLGGHVLQRCSRDDFDGALQDGGAAAGHLRARLVLHRAAGPRHPRAAPHQPAAARDRQAPAGAAARHQRQPLRPPQRRGRPRRAAVRADRLADERPRPLQVPRRRALPEVRRTRCGTCSTRSRRRATTRSGSPSGPTSPSSSASRSCPTFPLPGGLRDRRRLPAATSPWRAPASGGARGLTDAIVERLAYELERHREHGVLVVLPHRVGPHQARPRQRHPRRPGPGQRGRLRGRLLALDHRPRPDRVRPAVRAVPQPEPHLDARHRHGLRLPLPGRDDPLRGREVRARPRRPDRHVLHHQGPGRGARRRPGARLPVRPSATRWPRPCRRSIMGRDTPLYACLEKRPEVRGRLQDGRRPPEDAGRGRRRRQGDRGGQGPRGPAPPGRHPRRRGGDHQGAAHHLPADPAQAGGRAGPRGRADRHAVRDARRRGARPAQDGLPRPAQPRRHQRHRRDHPATRGASTSTSTPSRSTTRPPTRMLRRGEGIGIFQLEGGPMRALMRSLAPTSFEDVCALVALYRPGPDGGEHAQRLRRPQERPEAGRVPPPRRRGGARRHLRADDLPGESVMRVAQKFAGYSLAEADMLRKACGKKKRELIAKEREKFVAGCEATGYGAELGAQVLRHHRAVRRLRLRQVARLRLRLHRLPDRLPQGELPGRVPRPRCSPA